ncbi:hypothetical protein GQS40_09375|uniref:Uncharacterized protein n=1 Tax=Leuconostoc lactis TaxID=1246 RepID=A0A6L7ACN6_LEULA|nr:hypothetical protein [Leuconostoc lactis]
MNQDITEHVALSLGLISASMTFTLPIDIVGAALENVLSLYFANYHQQQIISFGFTIALVSAVFSIAEVCGAFWPLTIFKKISFLQLIGLQVISFALLNAAIFGVSALLLGNLRDTPKAIISPESTTQDNKSQISFLEAIRTIFSIPLLGWYISVYTVAVLLIISVVKFGGGYAGGLLYEKEIQVVANQDREQIMAWSSGVTSTIAMVAQFIGPALLFLVHDHYG